MLIPLAIVIQIAMPGTLGTFKAILQPSYVIQEQSHDMGTGSGRIADLGPSLAEWSRTPFLGQGFGTRVVATDLGPGGIGEAGGAQILDDQWLGTLLEIGAVARSLCSGSSPRGPPTRAPGARSDPGPDGWLMTALAASLIAYAVGMLTFDAFAFIQVTFLAFIMFGFMAVATRDEEPAGHGRKRIGVAFPRDPEPAGHLVRHARRGDARARRRGRGAGGRSVPSRAARPRAGRDLIAAGYLGPRRDVRRPSGAAGRRRSRPRGWRR